MAMDFSKALLAMKAGLSLTRKAWQTNELTVRMQVPDENSKMTKPYLYLSRGTTAIGPWMPGPLDFFTDDWLYVDELVDETVDKVFKNGEETDATLR